MEALYNVVRARKARYIGASSMYAWEFLKANHVARENGWIKFVTMQNHYNLMYLEEEREMLPLCRDEKNRCGSVEPAYGRKINALRGTNCSFKNRSN